MSRRPRSRPVRRRVPRAGALLVVLLGTLLLTLAHCPPHLFGDGHHGHDATHERRLDHARAALPAGLAALSPDAPSAAGAPRSASPEGSAPEAPAPPHQGHGPACSAPALGAQAQAEGPSPKGSAAYVRHDASRAPPAPAAPPGADGPLIDRSGRTTLTGVCRWRV
ncbi:hypothetical protein [Streptomyces sp. NPDC048606]|uniref:hypothetical protein n=1 Tax=Streptomyces sp. NPDC048606 TaxID=3154726 RepID=UPI003412B16D